MKTIPLSQGKVALVDDADYDAVSGYRWFAAKIRRCWYAHRNETADGKRKTVAMHRLLMGRKPGYQVDHKNNDGLDNRRENLRFCTQSENVRNSKARVNHTSSYKGVSLQPASRRKPWQVNISVNKRIIYIGVFETELQAALAYNEAAKKYHGEFARLNVVG